MKQLAVACTLCVLAAGAGAEEAPAAAPSPPVLAQPQGDAGRDKPATQPQSAPPAPIIVNVQPPARTEAEAQKEERERQEKAHLDRRLVELTGDLADYTRWLAYATAALFAVTAGLFWFAVRQARDAREAGRASQRSADAAMRSAEIAERALGGAEPPYLYPILRAFRPEEVTNFPHAEGNQSIVIIEFGNYGRSPAIVHAVNIEVGPCNGIPDVGPPNFTTFMPVTTIIVTGERQVVLRVGVGKGIEKAMVDGVAPRSQWPLYVYGHIRYADLSGAQFLTYICQYYGRENGSFYAMGGQDKNYRRQLTPEEFEKARAVPA